MNDILTVSGLKALILPSINLEGEALLASLAPAFFAVTVFFILSPHALLRLR